MQPIRVLLVDDHPEFLASAGAFLSRFKHINVLGFARSGAEAVQLTGELGVDLVIMDQTMPGLTGLDATRLLRLRRNRVFIIIFSFLEKSAGEHSALLAGADAYVSKSEFTTDIIQTINELFDVPVEQLEKEAGS